MKHLLFAVLLIVASACAPQPGSRLVLATWNIRYDNPNDGVNAWPARKQKVFDLIADINPDILCLQEVLSHQTTEVAAARKQYAWVGVGRDDGISAGEYVPIFHNSKRFTLLSSDHFWLSDAPGLPGKVCWDAACPRMATWVLLRDKSTGDSMFVFNTHFDHVGAVARLESARLITRVIDSLCGSLPVLLAGDFNCIESDEPVGWIISQGFADARTVSLQNPAGPEYTFTGFDITQTPGHRIDFIFVRNAGCVEKYATINRNDGKYYSSDHLPVVVTLQ